MSGLESTRSLLISIVRQNLTEKGSIITQHINDGATSSAVLLSPTDIPTTLDRSDCPNLPPCIIRVTSSDVLTAAISILGAEKPSLNGATDEEEEDEEEGSYDASLPDIVAAGKTIILNAYSDDRPGGNYTELISSASRLPAHPLPPTPSIPPDWQLHVTQEEFLCLATTLHTTLDPQWYSGHKAPVQGIYSPGVVIFRDPRTLTELPHSQCHVVSILSLPQVQHRQLTPDGTEFEDNADLDVMRRKLRFLLRIAAMNGQERLVLGECKSHNLPPGLAAREVKAALAEEEFRGWFREAVFAVREGSIGAYRKALNGAVVVVV
ncbi:hypothetical protein L211DRAFT_68145 [Terfezia boudieri ATCC MYA-4762]|uniref:Uncharacterized protein n=1 Tax=Terfezia boudieri ATCC MYA-4762 TaxID=1051890 RepID=A0A3N4LXU3_9PEZI|nr:hypothetical protein L211DRAFT_68145 [Terfezia boudieri ATCC MYA-4762]